MTDFSIRCRWESALHEAPEVRETSAMIKVMLGDMAITRNEDIWSQTVRDDVRLSAYPLALWFAASWWRLRWEPLPASAPSHSWRMAHELAAAGHGYVWPRMLFASDGENIQTWAVQSAPTTTTAVRYLTSATYTLQSSDFERALDDFIGSVTARLDAVEIQATTLHGLWEEVITERNDAEIAAYRRLEAMLGFDPDECPESLHDHFSDMIPKAGADAVEEIAAVCASDPEKKLKEIIEFSTSNGLEGRIEIPAQEDVIHHAPPWQRGRTLAKQVRSCMGLGGTPIEDGRLCELLGLSKEQAINTPSSAHPPLGMAIRHDGTSRMKFLLSKRNRYGRRFELARLLGDHLMGNINSTWLPATNTKTARQKAQRAFAAELLCPIDALQEQLDGDFSNDAMDDAAEDFGVSTEAVKTQLVNNGLLSSTALGDYSRLEFPYAA